MAKLKLEVFTPRGRLIEAEVDRVTAPGVLGEFTVLPEHRPALIRLGGGALRYGDDPNSVIFLRGGVAEVRRDGVLVLTEEGVRGGDGDRERAEGLLSKTDAAFREREVLTDERLAVLREDQAFAEAVLRTAGH